MDFNERVYAVVSAIPKGQVSTYRLVATAAGDEKACRAVGNILHSNPNPEQIPCHRVVNSNGKISVAYKFGGLVAQRTKLEEEGIHFKGEDTIDNFERYLYIPQCLVPLSESQGICKYCFKRLVKEGTRACPRCRKYNPYQPFDDGIQSLLKKGSFLYAVRLLTEAKGISIAEAKQYCESLKVSPESSTPHSIDKQIEELVATGDPRNYVRAVKLVRDEDEWWGLKEAKVYIDVMYPSVKAYWDSRLGT